MRDLYNKIVNSEGYSKFIASHSSSYLSHVSLIDEKGASSGWEFGFFYPADSKITVIEANSLKVRKPDEALSESGNVKKLELEDVSVEGVDALKLAEENAKLKGIDVVSKKIITLQNTEDLQWNITFLTADFKIFNIKINAVSGEVNSSDLSTVFDLGLRQN